MTASDCGSSQVAGRGQVEDPVAVMKTDPDWNECWGDKRADFSKIKIPAYILASYSSGLHTEGSFRCYEEMTAPKWYVQSSEDNNIEARPRQPQACGV